MSYLQEMLITASKSPVEQVPERLMKEMLRQLLDYNGITVYNYKVT